MPLEVPCPNCKAVLRAPDEAVGRKVKCKKCEHRFVIPGGNSPPDSQAETQQLSVVEVPKQAPAPMAMPPAPSAAVSKPAPIKVAALIADPVEVLVPDGDDLVVVSEPAPAADAFAFDVAPAKNGKKHDRSEAAPAPVPLPAVGEDAFAFDASAPATKPSKSSKAAKATDDDAGDDAEEPRGRKAKAKSSGSKKLVLILAGAFGLMCLGVGGAAAAVYFFMVQKGEEAFNEMAATSKPQSLEAGKTTAKTNEVPPPANDRDAKAANAKEVEPPAPKPGLPAKGAKVAPPVAPPEAPAAAAFALPAAPAGKIELVARKKESIALELPAAAVRGARFSSGNPPAAAVLWRSVEGFQGAGAKDAIDLYAIQTLRRIDRVEFPADGFTRDRAFDLSPNGDLIALEGPPNKLTVYEFGSKQKPLDGIDPFDGAPQRAGPITAIRFITDDLVATFDSNGAADVFNLKTKARAAASPPPPIADKKAPPAATSEVVLGKVLVFARGQLLTVTGTNGGHAAPFPIGDPSLVPLGVAVDATFKKAAVAYRTPSADPPHTLAITSLVPGSKPRVIPLPADFGTPAGVQFVGDAAVAVLADDRSSALLFDLEGNAMVGYLKRPNEPAVQIPDGTAGRYWWIVPDPTDPKKSSLTSVEMPFDEYFKLAGEAKASKKPIFLVPQADGLGR